MLKIFLMTKNELELLEDWLKYHGYLFGFENIYVLDGSDDDRVFAIYDRYKMEGLNVHYSSNGLNDLAKELTELMHAHKGTNTFLIKLDTDEFLAYTRNFESILRSRNNIKNPEICVDNFSQFFADLPITGQRYKASLTAWSIPRNGAVANVCRDLIEFTPLQFTQIKTFFHSDSFVSVDLGSHNGVSTNNEGVIDTALTLIHYHSVSVDDSARRARQVLISHKYISAEDSVVEQRQKLRSVRSKGAGVLSYHKIDFYLEYLDYLEGGDPINPELLNKRHSGFRPTGPSNEMTLIRDTLNVIDRERRYGS